MRRNIGVLILFFVLSCQALSQEAPYRTRKLIADTLVSLTQVNPILVNDTLRLKYYARMDSGAVVNNPTGGAINLFSRGVTGIYRQNVLGTIKLDSTYVGTGDSVTNIYYVTLKRLQDSLALYMTKLVAIDSLSNKMGVLRAIDSLSNKMGVLRAIDSLSNKMGVLRAIDSLSNKMGVLRAIDSLSNKMGVLRALDSLAQKFGTVRALDSLSRKIGTNVAVDSFSNKAQSNHPFVTIGNVASLSGERAITGTTNLLTVTDNGVNSTVVLKPDTTRDNPVSLPTRNYTDSLDALMARKATTMTIAANAPLSSSAGAQDLSANRTWTLSADTSTNYSGLATRSYVQASISAGSAHNILSATHTDATAATVVRGDIITGQAVSPLWKRLALGATGTILRSDGTDLVYSAVTYPNVYAVGDLVHATGTGTLAGLADVAVNQVLVSGGVGVVPAYSATPQITSLGLGVAQSGLQTLTMNNGTDFAIHNITPNATNYERLRFYWSGNQAFVAQEAGGTGSNRSLVLSSGTGNNSTITLQRGNTPFFAWARASAFTETGNHAQFLTKGSASSGTQVAFAIIPTWTQSSTAAYTALLVNPTETSTGSGAKLLADLQVGGTSKFKVDNTGLSTIVTGHIAPDIWGSVSSAGNLTLNSTSHATKGKILFGASGAYDEANERFGINDQSPASRLDIVESTLGNEITRTSTIKSTTESDVMEQKYQNEVVTTNATQTTIFTIATTTDYKYLVTANVVWAGGASGVNAGGAIIAGTFENTAGVVIQTGTTTSLHAQADAGSVTYTVSGSSLRVSVTGVALTTYKWHCTVTINKMFFSSGI